MTNEELLAEQVAYYRARAPQYDDWWHRVGAYELPPAEQARWMDEVAQLEARVDRWLGGVASGGRRALELASGTGIWTTRLAPWATSVLAVDAAPETIAINRSKLEAAGVADRVAFEQADLFEWSEPEAEFDVVFFSFWLSHVPPEKLEWFWQLVRRALRPGGRAIFIDNRWTAGVWPNRAPGTPPPADPVSIRTDVTGAPPFRIVKVYYEPAEIESQLRSFSWRDVEVSDDLGHFVAGWATP